MFVLKRERFGFKTWALGKRVSHSQQYQVLRVHLEETSSSLPVKYTLTG